MKIIPFPKYPRFSEQVSLDGVIYNLFFDWNDRGSYWTMTITDINNTVLLANLKIVPNFDIHKRYALTSSPAGAFAVYSRVSNSSDISYEDFISTRELIYLTEAELGNIPLGSSTNTETSEETLIFQEVTDTDNAVLLQETTDSSILYQEISNG